MRSTGRRSFAPTCQVEFRVPLVTLPGKNGPHSGRTRWEADVRLGCTKPDAQSALAAHRKWVRKSSPNSALTPDDDGNFNRVGDTACPAKHAVVGVLRGQAAAGLQPWRSHAMPCRFGFIDDEDHISNGRGGHVEPEPELAYSNVVEFFVCCSPSPTSGKSEKERLRMGGPDTDIYRSPHAEGTSGESGTRAAGVSTVRPRSKHMPVLLDQEAHS